MSLPLLLFPDTVIRTPPIIINSSVVVVLRNKNPNCRRETARLSQPNPLSVYHRLY